MAVKWVSAMVAAAALSVFATANLVAARVPDAAIAPALNLLLIGICAVGAILAAVVDLYERLDARVSVLSDFLVTRLDEIVTRLDELEAGRGLEAILRQPDVVPLPPRAARYRRGEDHGSGRDLHER